MTPFTSVLSAKRITRFLFQVISLLGIAHLIGISLNALTRDPHVITAVKLVNLTREHNIPTLFTVCLFIFNAGLFFIIHRNTKTFHERHLTWPLLGGTFAFLALDEFGSIHEQFSTPLRETLDTAGSIFHFAWVIPYSIAGLGIAILIAPTITKLQPKFRKWFFLAAILYISGALGIEMIIALNRHMISETNFFYGLLAGVEELLEMSGLTILAYAILRLIEVQYGGINLVIPNQNSVYQKYIYDLSPAVYTSDVPGPGEPIDFTPDRYLEYPERIPEPQPGLYVRKPQ